MLVLADELLNPIKGFFVSFSSFSRLAKDLRNDSLASSNSSVSLLLRKYLCYQPLIRHGMMEVRLSWLVQVLLQLVAT